MRHVVSLINICSRQTNGVAVLGMGIGKKSSFFSCFIIERTWKLLWLIGYWFYILHTPTYVTKQHVATDIKGHCNMVSLLSYVPLEL